MAFQEEGMRTIRYLFFRLFSVFRSGRARADLTGRTEPHLRLLQDKVPSAGEQAKGSQHESRSFRALDSWWLDVKLGVRMLVKYPGLALAGGAGIAVAVALAAGGYSAIYGMFLVSSLPLEEGDRIVSIEIWDAAAGEPERRSLYDYYVWREGLSLKDCAPIKSHALMETNCRNSYMRFQTRPKTFH
jgi:hypothetical protein